MSGATDDLGDGGVFAMGLFEAAPDAILIVRPGGIIALANKMAERMFGYDRSELVGQPIEMLVPHRQRTEHAVQRAGFQSAPRVREMGRIAELEALRKNGHTVPVEISLSPVDSPAGQLTIAIIRDVTRHRELEAQLRFANTHDSLTDLFNRAHLDTVRSTLEATAAPVGVIMLDVDGLKQVNDRLGHEAGDHLLRRCGVVLRAACDASAVVARLGGDEFAVLVPSATQEALDQAVAHIREELARNNELTREPKLEFSLGSALSDKQGGIAQAMRLADRRMYDHKRSRRQSAPR